MYETSEGKAEPGPDFVISMSPAYARLGVGLEFLPIPARCETYVDAESRIQRGPKH